MAEGVLIKILGDTKGFESALKSLGGIASNAFKLASGAILAGTSAATVLTAMAVKGFAEYEQLVGGVDTLFKNSSQKVQEYANVAYKTAGMSANKYMETVTSFSASLLQSLGGDTQKAAEAGNQAVIDMSDNANKMGTSMEMIQNAYQGFAKQNYTMLDNLKLGYGGTKEEMQRLLIEAEKISGIEYDINNLNDVYSAIHIIQKELGITGTTALEASTTIQGSFDSMKASFNNLVVGLADKNADINELIQKFIESLTIFGENLIPVVETAITGIAKMIERISPIIASKLPELFQKVLPPLLNAAKSIIDVLITSLPKLMIEFVPSIVRIIAEQAPKLIESGISLIKELGKGIQANVSQLAGSALKIIKFLADEIIKAIPLLANTAKKMIIELANAINSNVQILKPFTNVIKFLMDNLEKLIPVIGATVLAFATFEVVNKISTIIKSASIAITATQTALNAYAIAAAAAAAGSNAAASASAFLLTQMTAGQVIIGVLTGKIKLATAAQLAWSTAMSANYIGITIAAIAGLVVGISALIIAFQNEKSETQLLNEKSQERINDLKEEKKAYEEARQASDEKAAGDIAQIEYVSMLKDELEGLIDSNGNIIEGYEGRVSFIENELGQATGLEIGNIRTLITEYNGLFDANGNLIAGNEERAAQIQEELTQATGIEIKGLQDTSTALREVISSIDELIEKRKYEIFQKAELPFYEEAIRNQVEKTIETTKAAMAINETKNKIEALYAENNKEWTAERQRQITELLNSQKTYTEEYETSAEQLGKYNADITRYETAQKLSLEGNIQEAIALLASRNDALDAQLQKVKGNAEEENRILNEAYNEALSQQEFYKTQYTNGVEGYTAEGLAILTKHVQDMKAKAIEIGKAVPEGMAAGIKKYAATAINAANELALGVVIASKLKLESKSPSKVMERLGKDVDLGFAIGIEKNSGNVIEATENMTNIVLDTSEEFLKEHLEQLETFNSTFTEYTEKNGKKIYKTQEQINEQKYKNSQEYIDLMYEQEEISTKEKIKLLEYTLKNYELTTAQKIQLEKKMTSAIKDQTKEAQEYIDLMYEQEKINIEEKIKLLKYVIDNYELTNSEQIQLEKKLTAAIKEQAKEIEEINKNNYNMDKEMIEAKKRNNEIGLAEEFKLWSSVQEKYLEGTEQRLNAEKEVYAVKEKIISELEKIAKNYADEVEKRTQQIFNSFSLFEEIQPFKKIQSEDLMKSLSTQVDIIKEWSESIQELAKKGIDEGLVNELEKMGPKSLAEVEALLKMTQPELEKYSELYKEKTELARIQAEAELEELKEKSIQQSAELMEAISDEFSASPIIGKNMTDGLAKGILNGMSKVIKAAIQVSRAAIESAQKELGIQSPSKKFEEIGIQTAAGFEVGTNKSLSNIKDTIKDDFLNIVKNAKSIINSNQFSPMSGIYNSYMSTNTSNITTNSPTLVFNEPVESPEIVARRVNQVMRFGLAGAR